MLLYTYATQRPIGTCARSLHVGTPAHVYTVPTAGSPTYARTGRYATVAARAGYTWAHSPTCAPYTAVWSLTSARAPVVTLQQTPRHARPTQRQCVRHTSSRKHLQHKIARAPQNTWVQANALRYVSLHGNRRQTHADSRHRHGRFLPIATNKALIDSLYHTLQKITK